MTGGGWGQDPFGGSPFGGDPFAGPPMSGGPVGGPPPMFTSPAPPPFGAGEVNTLATLSVVFAFLFAPAGAVLGHLGLRQTARTGQPGRQRALVGMALSYTVIVVEVVALVVWAVTGTGSDGAAPDATATASSRPTMPSTSPSGPPATSTAPSVQRIDLPKLNPGRIVAAPDLPGLLVGLEDVKRFIADATDAPPVPNLTAAPPVTALEPTPGAQGSMDPADCAPTMIANSEVGYRDGGYTAVYSVTMSQPGPDGEQSATQAVIAFPDPAAAQRALLGMLNTVARCAARQTSGQAEGYFQFTEPHGGVTGSWGSSALNLNTPVGYGNEFYAFDAVRFKPDTTVSSQMYIERRSIGLKGNALVDVAVRGLSILGQDQSITSQVLKNLT